MSMTMLPPAPEPSTSERGTHFAERLLKVGATCRQQGRPLSDLVVAVGEAALRNGGALAAALQAAGRNTYHGSSFAKAAPPHGRHPHEDQLHVLHHVVAQRLQLAQKAHALAAMSQFQLLDHVAFVHNGKQYEGTVTRLNQKTISIIIDDGTRWNVASSLLTKVADRKETAPC